MFIKTKRKIKWYMLIFLFLFIAIECIFSIVNIKQNAFRNLESFSKESINLNIKNCDYLIHLASHVTDMVVKDTDLITKVKKGGYSLNSLKFSTLSIMGVTLYDLEGNYYYSQGMAGVLSLEELQKEPEIKAFINDDSVKNIYSVRTTNINQIYGNNQIYQPDQGIISYINKLYNHENELIGYLFVDIDPRYLYKQFFSYQNDELLQGTITFIKTDSNYLHTSTIQSYEKYLSQITDSKLTSDQKFLIHQNTVPIINVEVITFVPLNNYQSNTIVLILPILLVCLCFIFLSIIVVKSISKQIVTSLSVLNRKMMEADQYILH